MAPEIKTLRIALIGYGRMGKQIHRLSEGTPFEVVQTISSESEPLSEQVDVCIDYSVPSAVLGNVKKAAAAGVHLVIGTTGWYSEIDQVEQIVKAADIGAVWANNFSIGAQLYLKLLDQAAALFSKYPGYDVSGMEIHHQEKLDAPSGTARLMMEKLLSHYPGKRPCYDLGNRKKEPEEIHFPCLRTGSVPGTHQIRFDSTVDTITLTHEARNREGFALGSLEAAEKIAQKKGFFRLEELL